MQRMDTGHSRYEQIALDIAQKIARGEFRVGQKLSGRSLLAGTYNVSPETIRRSIALLQNIGVVEAITGSGIIIKSSSLAKEYLTEFNERQEIIDLRNRINDYLEKRRQLDSELEKELARLLEFALQKSAILQQIEEIHLPDKSWVIGRSIADTDMRNRTGATVIAIIRNGEEIFSPPADIVLKENDILSIVGTSGAKERVKELLNQSEPV
ncbi:MAG: TrkA C-terminal domain-containing protein [Peptococcaceae bacterium]|jgi:K+/H+ antiporter YhaU regulatory subunit KhtT|nr:GntR family transcriptional regulator [Peptococcaceae bacterium]MDH7523791.1 TrkA C-terminal domain-containing protein [Peptococcaceae bacterium]